jgi:hypothetical protein
MAHLEGTTTQSTERPTKVYRGKSAGVNVTVEIYGELSEQAIKNFNRVFHDAMDEIEKRHHKVSA